MAMVSKQETSPRRRNRSKKLTKLACVFLCVFVIQMILLTAALRKKEQDGADGTQNDGNTEHISSIDKLRTVAKSHFHNVNLGGVDNRPDRDLPRNVKLRSMETQIVADFGLKNARACRWYRKNYSVQTQQRIKMVKEEGCGDDDGAVSDSLVVHNPLHVDRYLCGKLIPAFGFTKFDEPCNEESRIYLRDATLNVQDISSPIVLSTSNKYQPPDETAMAKVFECDVPCRIVEDDPASMYRFTVGTPWKFIYSMQSPTTLPEIKVDPLNRRYNTFYATTSFQSEIPLPYFSWAEYNIQKPSIDFDKAIKAATFFSQDCFSRNDIFEIVANLSSAMRVDYFGDGDCFDHSQKPEGVNDPQEIKQQYLFNIVFELDNVVDFVTTGLWKTFETGTLPIYYGAPNINDLVPPKSIISWHDFNDTVALANHLIRVMTDKELYNSYHEWRKPPLSDKFVSLYNFTHTHSTCRLCRWSYAKLHGFAWDHTKQQVSDMTISRKLCYGYNLLITHPFRESWVNGAEMLRFSENPGQGQCHDTSVHSSTRVGSWTRTLWFHDGVTDILLEGSGDPVTYQIVTPLLESHLETKVAAHHFKIQGDSFRYTILTSWSAANPQFTNGVLNFELGFEKELRLRIITDEVDSFYPKSNQETSYFESIMIKDFFAPIEKFLVN